MKTILLLALLAICFCGFAQDSTINNKANTELGKIQLKIGTIIKKEYIDLYADKKKILGYSYSTFEVKILNLTDASTGIVSSGLYIYVLDEGGTYSSSRSYTSFIDFEELPGFIRFIDFLQKLESERPTTYTEYIFNNKDLKLYCYYDPNPEGRNQKSEWIYGLQVDTYSVRSKISIDIKKLLEIKNRIINLKDRFSKPLILSTEYKEG